MYAIQNLHQTPHEWKDRWQADPAGKGCAAIGILFQFRESVLIL
jgi:hypothetical protein